MWNIEYIKQARDDLLALDNSQRIQVVKAIKKVAENPISIFDGGYGKPLGNKNRAKLTGYYKIKLLRLGIRVIYTLVKEKTNMKIVVISARSDNYCYNEADNRK